MAQQQQDQDRQGDDRLFPQNLEAELAVLGSILIDPDALVALVELLRPDDFYARDAHRVIFEAACDLFRQRAPADLITLTDELMRRGKLEEAGGARYVSELAYHVPTSANVEHYARIVANEATRRRLIVGGGQIAAAAYQEPDPDAALGRAQQILLDVQRGRAGEGGFVPFSVAMDELLDDLLTRMDPQADRLVVQTGYRDLDRHMLGIEPGELVYLMGRPGSSKSTIAHQVVAHNALTCAARGSGVVAWATLEMRKPQVAKRVVCARAGINSRVVRAGFRRWDGTVDLALYARFKAAWDELREPLKRHLRVCDRASTIAQLRTRLARLVAEQDCRLLVVDYLNLIIPENRRHEERQRIMDLSRDLKQIAEDLRLPVVCLTQMNRDCETRENKRPQIRDLRDSGGLEQDGDWVLGVYRGAMYDKRRAARDEPFRRFVEVNVLKAREGVAENTIIPLRAELECSRVVDWDEPNWPDDSTREGGPAFGEGGMAAGAGGEEALYG